MMRIILWLVGGVLLGGIIHVVVILTLPMLAEETTWSRLSAYEAENKMLVLPEIKAGEPNPLGLDPELVYGLCQVDLSQGPVYLSGILPDAFWSLAIFNEAGTVTYSTTNRDGIGQTVELGIFNQAQTRLLAQQQLDIEEGLLVVEAESDRLALVLRLAPPHEAVRARFAERLSAIRCGPRP
ncbi:hypothetical protein VW35_16575 [Devosia soli]|uniref:DUF1254 domain-containing protein n=1 Tax=Devosia soli TaxID=361041 RepID=A0A0F5L2I1_9HYPH|nr:hypothetical protein [Devosia soli]KKB76425.1 hypothetical protein VW35_16575 [Devosia soli]